MRSNFYLLCCYNLLDDSEMIVVKREKKMGKKGETEGKVKGIFRKNLISW
jgi:hypothetical protein